MNMILKLKTSGPRHLRGTLTSVPFQRQYFRLLSAATLIAGLAASSPALAQTSNVHAQAAGPLAGVVEPYLKSHEIAGAVVLVADRNRVIDREALGYADIAGRRFMAPNDLFWIASMSKAITASAVMMLVDEGKIRLDDPVEKYLPAFKGQLVESVSDSPQNSTTPPAPPGQPAKHEPLLHPITVREILCHTSGLRFRSNREPGALDLLPLKSAVDSYAA